MFMTGELCTVYGAQVYFNEIIDLLLCQGVVFTVLLIIIHELFVYVHLITYM